MCIRDSLKHLGRTRVLLHLVDASGMPGVPPLDEQVAVIEQELAAYGGGLLVDRPRWLVLNKLDVLDAEQRAAALAAAGELAPVVHGISAATREGVSALLEQLAEWLSKLRAEEAAQAEHEAAHAAAPDMPLAPPTDADSPADGDDADADPEGRA